MGFLRITQSLLDFACECSRIKKQLTNLKNMNMTKNDLVEYLERTRSQLQTDLNFIFDMSMTAIKYNDNSYIFNTIEDISASGEELIENLDELIKQLCK